MSADQIFLLAAGLVAIAAVALAVAYATGQGRRRMGAGAETTPPRSRTDEPIERAAGGKGQTARDGGRNVSPVSTRQVARVVAFLYLAAVAVVVALSRAWPESEPAIFTLLAGGSLLVVLFMDMLPPSTFGRWRRPIEGVGAIVFLGLIMALTGGTESPFFVGFFLVVAGTALATEGLAPLAIAVLAALTVALVGILVSIDEATQAQGLAWIGFIAVALILLADIAAAAARTQRQAREEALRASRFDALTGLYNRAFFFTTMEQEIRRSERMGRGFTMLMLDLDDLKPVNDTFGHQWGDRLLKAVADAVRQTIRFTDAAARYGGDEFVVLLPETDASGGYVVGEKLRRDIATLTLLATDRSVRSSVSIGLVTFPEDGETIEQLVAAADVAMYEAKRRGKNRIVGYETRMERVATAMRIGEAALVQLGPGGEVRTGGDPAPWLHHGEPGGGHGQAVTLPRATGEAPPPAAPHDRRPERTALPVEPERTPLPIEPEGGGADWQVAPEPAVAPATQEPGPGGTSPTTSRRPEGQPAPGQPERGGAPQRGPDEPASGPDAQPWLTRTDGTPSDRRADDRPERRSSQERPGSESRRSSDLRRSTPPGTSRADRFRTSGDRPWIVLPIERDEPSDRPPN